MHNNPARTFNNNHALPTSTTYNNKYLLYEIQKEFSQYLGQFIQLAQSPKVVH